MQCLLTRSERLELALPTHLVPQPRIRIWKNPAWGLARFPFNSLSPFSPSIGTPLQWIWENLLGDASWRSVARDTLEDGGQEVEGPPPAWHGAAQWNYRDLRGEPHAELRGQRCAPRAGRLAVVGLV